MPITPCDSQIPLPSPIPTGRGSRSAANEIFSKFLEKKLQKLHLPELTLPELHQPPAPAEIDLWSLPLASAPLLQRSAKEFGAFRIRSHGISSYDLETIAKEAEVVFKDTRKVYVERNGRCGGMIPCVRSSNGELEFTARNQTHRKFWYICSFCFNEYMQTFSYLNFHLFRFVLLIFWILNQCNSYFIYTLYSYIICILNSTYFKLVTLVVKFSTIFLHKIFKKYISYYEKTVSKGANTYRCCNSLVFVIKEQIMINLHCDIAISVVSTDQNHKSLYATAM